MLKKQKQPSGGVPRKSCSENIQQKETLTQMFSYEYCESFQGSCFVAASEVSLKSHAITFLASLNALQCPLLSIFFVQVFVPETIS